MEKMKILVLSVSAISDEESNGRVLKSLLPDSELCSFLNVYISGQPSADSNIKFLHFTDKNTLKSLLTLGICSKSSHNSLPSESTISQKENHYKKKKPVHYLIRNIVWKFAFGIRNIIMKSAKQFNPNIVFLMGANMPFLFKMARLISKKTHSSLIIYNAEDYPLKKYDYISCKSSYSLTTRLVQCELLKEAKKAYKISKYNIFNSDKLLSSYLDEKIIVSSNSGIIRIPSGLSPVNYDKKNKKILYAGNLYDDRCKTLLEFANALKDINSEFKLVVYGKITNKLLLEQIKNNDSIEYKGVIPFSELKEQFSKFSFLLHIDGFSDYSKLDYKYAFSTKIADYLILGVPFICYGSNEIAGVDFLYKLNSDFTIVSKEELLPKLKKILSFDVVYKQDRAKINYEFSERECRSRMFDLFKKFESNNKI